MISLMIYKHLMVKWRVYHGLSIGLLGVAWGYLDKYLVLAGWVSLPTINDNVMRQTEV